MSEQPQSTVLMAMSGGVDSSVSALLLSEAGYKVTGATMRLFLGLDNASGAAGVAGGGESYCYGDGDSSCCSTDDIAYAQVICKKFGFEHKLLNMTDAFRGRVIDHFCKAYLSGETPNPCIDCNRYLKFQELHRFRANEGFDYLATGHYARRDFDETAGRFRLLRARDPKKDQSYVLYCISQDTLAHTLFPLGDLTKEEVRALAAKRGFANAEKPDSQDICFIPDGDISTFVHNYSGCSGEPGYIVNVAGEVLGRHDGLENYTLGQRKGIGVAAAAPLYVMAKNLERNELVVGFDEEARTTEVFAKGLNLIHLEALEDGRPVQAKTNYRQSPKSGRVYNENDGCVRVVFDQPIRPAAPGQALVLYDGEVVLGGATITGNSL